MPRDILVPRRALISVSDKSGITDFARHLKAQGIEILSTGGTAKVLSKAGIAVKEVSEHTGYAEIMEGRVKTLHPRIHGGILARRDHDATLMREKDIVPIDLVVVNLYPFCETIAREGVRLTQAIETIDIGGPAMLRSAAKNHKDVAVVVDPVDYPQVIQALEAEGIDPTLRRRLAIDAFRHTADYDRAIANYLTQVYAVPGDEFPERLTLDCQLSTTLRYGENPHQRAALYRSQGSPGGGLADAIQHQGKALSYNNLVDADAALRTVMSFPEAPACVIVKHANPCGVALGENIGAAYTRAYRTDPTSAFGGIIAFNRGLDKETAREIISRQFVEVLLAPSFSADALEVLKEKPKVRLLAIENGDYAGGEPQIQSIRGGILVQDWDTATIADNDLEVMSEREPNRKEIRDLLFAWRVVQAVKSNAIVLAGDQTTLGIGAGQTSRVDAARIAALKAADQELDTRGAVLAGDAFFPFRDGIDAAAAAGVSAIIQPGGSIRDQEVITAANEHGIAMVFTGVRHFRH